MLLRSIVLLRLAGTHGGSGSMLKVVLPKHIGLLRNWNAITQNVFYHNGLCCQQFEVTAKRGVRTFPNDLHDQKNKSKPKNSREQKGEKGSSSAGEKDTTQGFELKKPSTEDVKRVRRMMLIFAVTATGITFFLFTSPEFKEITNPTATVTMEELLNVYLPTGEVKKLIFVTNRNQLVVLLHPGAMIQGRPAVKTAFIVQCGPNDTLGSVTQVIRERERAMGISPISGLAIDSQEMWGNTSYFVLFIGMLLFGYLSARLTLKILRRALEGKGVSGTKRKE